MIKYTFREVLRRRRKSDEEARRTEIWYGKYFVRTISPLFTWLCLALGLSANAVTVLSYVIGLASAVAFGISGPTGTFWGVLLLHLAFVIDNVDGEVARVTGTGSMTGAYLDTLGHIIVNGAVLFGIGFGQYVMFSDWWILPLSFVAAYCHVPLSRYSLDHEILNRLREALRSPAHPPASTEPVRAGSQEHRAIETTLQMARWLKRIGFPFNSTPYNILLITAASLYDELARLGWLPAMSVSGLSITIVYFSIVLPLQQIGSIMRNTRGRTVDREIESLMNRLH